MPRKIYVAYKSDSKVMPHLHCKFHKDSPPIDLYAYGIRYFEDNLGYYYKQGELICNAE